MNHLLKYFICIFISAYSITAKCQNWLQWGNGYDCTFANNFFVDTINNNLYVSGGFVSLSGTHFYGIAKWADTTWTPLGSGVFGSRKMLMYNGKLCTISGNYACRWNGTSWDTLGVSFNNLLTDMVIYNNELYVVGYFGNYIAKWDGTKWLFIYTTTALTKIRTAIVYKNELYVGGTWDGDSGKISIMRWDGIYWKSLGNGIILPILCSLEGVNDAGVHSLVIYQNELYASGCFYKAAGDSSPDDCIARWDGNQWHAVGGGLNVYATYMAVFNNELYASGAFTTAGGIPAKQIAKWDGSKWCSIDTNAIGGKLAVYNNELLLGSGKTFTNIGINSCIIKWTGGNYVDTCSSPVGIHELSTQENDISIYPNPSTNNFTLEFSSNANGMAELSIFSLLGEKVFTDKIKMNTGTNKTTLDLAGMARGVYVLRVNMGEKRYYKKIVKE